MFSKETRHILYSSKIGNFKNFCSSDCFHKSTKTSITKNCTNCDKEFFIAPSKTNRAKRGKNFCCKQCANSYNNRLYRSGSDHPLYDVGKSLYRKLALESKKIECVKCGYSNIDILQVHHIDGNRENNVLDNLEILCPTHHAEKTLEMKILMRV